MKFELTVKNYRCFAQNCPATIQIQPGLTALLGVNNAGKSSLLKPFFEFRNLFQIFAGGDFGPLINAFKGHPHTFNYPHYIKDLDEIFSNVNSADLAIGLRLLEGASPGASPTPPREVVFTVPRATNHWIAAIIGDHKPLNLRSLGFTAAADGTSQSLLVSDGHPVADLQPYRDACQLLADTLYVGPFRNAINAGSMSNYFDIDIGQAFINRWRQFKTGHVKKHNVAAGQLTEDIRHIFSFEKLEINPTADDQTLQLLIDGRSYLLQEQGAGLAQFIVVLANAATRRPSYILIDEPELNLHPSLQIDFLTSLASYARKGVLFATHSYGLARATADSVFSVQRRPDHTREVRPLESTPRLSAFLGELSYGGYQEVGFGKVLLVEGATEVKTIQQFLRRINKDHQVVLLPLGGAQLIHTDRQAELLEIKRICPNVSALIDSERAVKGAALDAAHEGFRKTCEACGIDCHVLERRATENYLTDRAVKAVKGEKYRALGEFEKRENLTPVWGKSENWRIAREMDWAEVKGTDLGAFLDRL
jgi:ABC-type cobalamin/Fe3+-siderophores transport system ATPase subunit